MSSIDEVIEILAVDDFKEPTGYALRLNGKRVFVNDWDRGTSFVKEITQEQLWKIIALLKSESGLVSTQSIEDFLLIKYITPYVIRINFPPTSRDYYVDIYAIGSEPPIHARISELWKDKAAYNWLRDFLLELNLI